MSTTSSAEYKHGKPASPDLYAAEGDIASRKGANKAAAPAIMPSTLATIGSVLKLSLEIAPVSPGAPLPCFGKKSLYCNAVALLLLPSHLVGPFVRRRRKAIDDATLQAFAAHIPCFSQVIQPHTFVFPPALPQYTSSALYPLC